MKINRWALVLSLCLVPSTMSYSQEKPLQAQSEPSEEEVQGWIRDLGSPNFDEREIASSKLIDMGAKALPYLEKAVKNSKESEVRWNAKRLMQEIRSANKSKPDFRPAPGNPDDRARNFDRLDDLMRQMREQQERMRRMMDDRFHSFHDNDPMDPDLNDFGFDFGDLDLRLKELEERVNQLGAGSTGQSFSLSQGSDGIRLEIRENKDGKEEVSVYEAQNMDEFKKKYPEIAEKYHIDGLGGGGQTFQFRLGSPLREEPRFRLHRALPRTESFQFFVPSAGERLGVQVDSVEPSLAAFLDLPEGVGLLVRVVEKSSLAEKMGVQPKDVLVSINEKEIRGSQAILRTLKDLEPGAELRLEVHRSGTGKMILKGLKEKKEAPPKALEKVEESPK